MRKAAIVVYKRHEFAARTAYRLQSLALLSSSLAEQSLAQRRDGGYRIHNLVGEHANQFNPRVHLTVSQFAVDVAHRDDAHTLAAQRGIGLTQRQRAVVEAAAHLVEMR